MANLQKNVILMPEKILEDQTCTVCKKYLSYPPTKIYYMGEIKCGRCSEENDLGVVSSFDKVAANITFPCVNRYEGCSNMIEYRNVPEHEKECKGGQYACPICSIGKCSPESVLHLLNHFKKLHKYNIINNPIVQINKGSLSSQYYLHYNTQSNVIILIFLCINGNVLFINISTVGDEPDLIQQQVKLFEKYPEKIISTSLWRACSSWNDNLKAFDISLNDELELFSLEFLFKESVKWICTTVSQLSSLEVPREMQEPALKQEPSGDNMAGIETVNSCLQGYPPLSLQGQEKKFRNVDSSIKGTFPRFHLESVKDSDLKGKLKNPIFSRCGKYIVDETGQKLIDMRCSFCENYFPLFIGSRYIFKCSNCSLSLCSCCTLFYTKSVPFSCLICFKNVEKIENYLCLQLYYYCRFDCGGCFRGSDLGRHDSCCNNPRCDLEVDDWSIITEQFGLHYSPTSKLLRTNIFPARKSIFIAVNYQKFYVMDKRGFQYILDCEAMSDKHVIVKIHHEYDLSKYFLTINLIDKNKLRRLRNCCSFGFEYSNTPCFAIIFKEKQY